MIAGTVFRDPGFAVAGAEVALSPAGETPAKSGKVKKTKATTDARGEFVFRVPAEPGNYEVSVTSKGLKSQGKQVSVQGEERVDVTFTLEPESNN